ncbi:MAG: cation:proton antiporter [Acidimicrobiales bacterium]
MLSADAAVVCAALFAYALISKRMGPTIISGPMIFVAAGLLTGPELLDVVDLGLELGGVELIGEATLAILLFSDANRIDTRALRKNWGLPGRLLGIGLPLTVALGTGLMMLLINGIDVWEAALIASILAPTDAALGQEVVTDPAVPKRIRSGLNAESGLNDGLVVPAVTFFTALTAEGAQVKSASFWARFVFEQIGLGLVIGIALGGAGGWLLTRTDAAGWVDGVWAQLATLTIAVGALTTANHFGGNGFIAAFVAGMAFGSVAPKSDHLGEFTEDTAQLMAAVSFFLFGNILLGPAIHNFSTTILLCAVAVLTIGRMIPVAMALIGTHSAPQTVVFVGWFGPRGLASILFGLALLEDELAYAEDFFSVVAWTVLLSVILHGASAAWGAKTYGEWWATMSEDERDQMPEAVHVTHQPIRRSWESGEVPPDIP